VSEQSPFTFRVVTSDLSDLDRMLAWRDEGLVASYVVTPWREAELEQLLRWGFEAWTLANADAAQEPTRTLLHDLKSPLTTILANADHLQTLAAIAPMLKELIASSSLTPERRRPLEQLADDLEPISEELTVAVRRITHMLDQVRATSDDVTHAQLVRTRAK
jgi:signal transduction histidine kinase